MLVAESMARTHTSNPAVGIDRMQQLNDQVAQAAAIVARHKYNGVDQELSQLKGRGECPTKQLHQSHHLQNTITISLNSCEITLHALRVEGG